MPESSLFNVKERRFVSKSDKIHEFVVSKVNKSKIGEITFTEYGYSIFILQHSNVIESLKTKIHFVTSFSFFNVCDSKIHYLRLMMVASVIY